MNATSSHRPQNITDKKAQKAKEFLKGIWCWSWKTAMVTSFMPPRKLQSKIAIRAGFGENRCSQ
jgi:hypothetical protein